MSTTILIIILFAAFGAVKLAQDGIRKHNEFERTRFNEKMASKSALDWMKFKRENKINKK